MTGRGETGFALVLTLVLLALLVLCVLALSLLVRVNGQIATASVYQVQAKQNALLALDLAQGRLQKYAGGDAVVTGTGGTGGATVSTRVRQWCGVWPAGSAGNPVWLVTGALDAAMPTLDPTKAAPVRLVGPGSVGTESVDKEYVEVGRESISAPDEHTGGSRVTGRYAYWVGDEGVKASAVVPAPEVQFSPSGGALRPNYRRLLGVNFMPTATTTLKVLAYEQLRFTAAGVSLLDGFHQLTLSSLALGSTAAAGVPHPGPYVVGAFNVNTTSESAWRAWLEYPDSNASRWGLSAARTLSAARGIRDRITARGRPFTSIADLSGSNIIQAAFDGSSPKVTTVTQTQLLAELAPVLTVRSDTFRIRAYGEAVNPVDSTKVEAISYCEAIVQRTSAPAANGLGRKFVLTYFRWLGPNDI